MAMGEMGDMPIKDSEIAFLSVMRTKWAGAAVDMRGLPFPKLD